MLSFFFEAPSHGFYTRCQRFVPLYLMTTTRLASGGWTGLAAQNWVPACTLRKVSNNSANPSWTGLAWAFRIW